MVGFLSKKLLKLNHRVNNTFNYNRGRGGVFRAVTLIEIFYVNERHPHISSNVSSYCMSNSCVFIFLISCIHLFIWKMNSLMAYSKSVSKRKPNKKISIKKLSNREIQTALVASLNNSSALSFSRIAKKGSVYKILEIGAPYMDSYDNEKQCVNLSVENIRTKEIHYIYWNQGYIDSFHRTMRMVQVKSGIQIQMDTAVGLEMVCVDIVDGSGKLLGKKIARLEFRLSQTRDPEMDNFLDDPKPSFSGVKNKKRPLSPEFEEDNKSFSDVTNDEMSSP